MPTFLYTARAKTGEKTEGTVSADDKRSAMLKIENMGYIPVSVEPETSDQPKAKKKIGRAHV